MADVGDDGVGGGGWFRVPAEAATLTVWLVSAGRAGGAQEVEV